MVLRRAAFTTLLPAVLALQAPRGWNSWDDFLGDAPEAATIAAAQYMSQNLLPFGWNIITTDEGWYQGNGTDYANVVDSYGRPTPDVNQFPSAGNGQGFKALSDKIHSMGLLFGVWTLRGIPKVSVSKALPVFGTSYTAADAAGNDAPCVWQPQTMGCARDPTDPTQCNAAAKAYYTSVAQWYAQQGIDLVKIDCMGGVGDVSAPGLADPDLFAFTSAMRDAGLTVSLSSGNGVTPANGTVYYEQGVATQYRVTPDFWDTWTDPRGPGQYPSGLRSKLDTALAYQQLFSSVPANGANSTPGLPWTGGVWPDLDMLQLGDTCHYNPSNGATECDGGGPSPTHFTQDEQTMLMSLWCAVGAPLIFGGRLPLRADDTWTLSLLTNPEVLSLHGNASSRAPVRVANGAGYPYYAWTAIPDNLPPHAAYVALFNGADWSANLTVNLGDLRLGDWHTYCARDLWARAPYPAGQKIPGTGQLTVPVNAHGAAVMLLTQC